MHSPLAVPRARRGAAPAEIDFGDADDGGGERGRGQDALAHEEEDDDDEDEDEDGDGDVVPMSLGSPAHGAVRKMGEIAAADGGDDGDGVDDFEAEMLQGFLDGDDGLPQSAVVEDEEESDVSEAE